MLLLFLLFPLLNLFGFAIPNAIKDDRDAYSILDENAKDVVYKQLLIVRMGIGGIDRESVLELYGKLVVIHADNGDCFLDYKFYIFVEVKDMLTERGKGSILMVVGVLFKGHLHDERQPL